MHVSSRSVHRWTKETKNKVLDPATSSKTIELAALFSKGANVFGSLDSFKQWLRTSNSALENKKPIDFLDSSIGFSIINDELGKIEYGVFA
jgi:putative toxin-antitoxin system antitoxin component (TIGR02293 family)